MTILKMSNDHGASIYHQAGAPDFSALEADGRIREVYDAQDLSAGDYTYSELDRSLILTGTGAILWKWIEDGKAETLESGETAEMIDKLETMFPGRAAFNWTQCMHHPGAPAVYSNRDKAGEIHFGAWFAYCGDCGEKFLTPEGRERYRFTAENWYVNHAPGYQSNGARLLRRIMYGNKNPAIVEIPMIHLSRPGETRIGECGSQDVETTADYDKVNCQRCLSAVSH